MSPPKKYDFGDDDDRLIRERYDSRSDTIDELAALLGVPRWAVSKRAQQLGLARCKERPWTAEDEEYLETNLPFMSIRGLSRRLKRSETAVALKAKRLGIRKSGEGYTLRSIAEAFGVDDHTVARWIQAGMLRARRRNSRRERDMYFISDQAVREFVRRYPLRFDLRKVDQLWFVDLLTNRV